ncbi:MAG: isoleucine--tRNA ligase [Myxococcota bacterium]|nr:isoleucine--tRNA ligase [Myxococcota bacterium]
MRSLDALPEEPFPTLEAQLLELWRSRESFRRSVEERSEARRFVFYDGPPFATGLPHYGHLVASTLKDIVPRYWTMRGYRVERRFGWDTHGLPIEMEMEKRLGLSGPSSVQEFGVGKFNEACRENVLRYTEEWEQVVTRLGRWVDFKDDYKTMDPEFMESVWWVFDRLWEQGLVYQDFRVMPYSWRLSTALSNFEANLDYRDVDDPAITVTLPLLDEEETALLVWTTTPWTLPSNLAAAVGAEIDYVCARRPDESQRYIVAEARLSAVLGEGAEVLERMKGAALVGRRYMPLFPYFAERAEAGCFRVIEAEHVTTESGTGLVHMAPDFGEEDFTACKAAGLQVLRAVDDEGNFKAEVSDFAGQNIKAADPAIIRLLKERGRLFKREQIRHSYPFCWRSGTPLIYRAVPAWFVKVEALRERMSAHNQTIHWVPEQVGQRRFGNWLLDARDWNISRNRFWGTPIPVWRCNDCETTRCVGSIETLEALTGSKVDDLHPHKIDHLTMSCDACGGEMRRISEVFDCWFESGSMPYAQAHYPFEAKEAFEAAFPAQFIAEGLDQTRGWFYTLLVLGTALFDRAPFQNVIVNGMVLAEDGSKMSKSKKNYPDPKHVLDSYGADALRAYLINSPIVRADPLRFSEEGVKEIVRTVLLPLRNAWSFFTLYARADHWHPATGLDGVETPALEDRPELDRWICSVLQSLIREVNTQMEGYYLYRVVPPLLHFIDDLTNWYIRRSRRRFWRAASDETGRVDKAAAYATLYEVLVTFSKVIAPVLPFISEQLYQHLVYTPGVAAEGEDSIHLCAYPEAEVEKIDEALEAQVMLTRQVVAMGRALRTQHSLKTRQPLPALTVVHRGEAERAALLTQESLILEELNIKRLNLVASDESLSSLSFKANFKTLGRRLGKKMKAAAAQIGTLSREQWASLEAGGSIEIEDEAITAEDVLVSHHPVEGVVLEVQGAVTVALDTQLDDTLIAEGLAREVTSRIQKLRKSAGLEITDRITLTLATDDAPLCAAVDAHRDWLMSETLADELSLAVLSEAAGGGERWEIEGFVVSATLRRSAG